MGDYALFGERDHRRVFLTPLVYLGGAYGGVHYPELQLLVNNRTCNLLAYPTTDIETDLCLCVCV